MGERSTFGEPLEMMAKGALLVLHQRLNQHVTGVQYQRERLRVPFGLRNVHCAGRFAPLGPLPRKWP